MRLNFALLALLALLALTRPAAAADAGAPSPPSECSRERRCAALALFYDATGGPTWINATGWSGGLASGCRDVCAWMGVACDPAGDSEGGALVRLDLESNNLAGSTEDARLADGLATLTQACGLRALRLGGNALRGALPPALLIGLRGLHNLTLYGNELTGTLPANGLAAMGGPGGLRVLNLGDCGGLEGPLPPEVGAMLDLTALDLSFNRAFSLSF
jgi:hypothetical protein